MQPTPNRGAVFAAGTSGIEATGNAIDGHGFRTDVGVIKHYSSDPSTYQDAIDFIEAKYNLTGENIVASGKSGKSATGLQMGYTQHNLKTGASQSFINNEAFANPNLLKETVAHEFAHAKYGILPNGTGGYKFRMGAPTLNGVKDHPEGWVFAAQNRGRLKIYDNGLFNPVFDYKSKFALKNLWIKQLPTRFNNKANIVWKYLR